MGTVPHRLTGGLMPVLHGILNLFLKEGNQSAKFDFLQHLMGNLVLSGSYLILLRVYNPLNVWSSKSMVWFSSCFPFSLHSRSEASSCFNIFSPEFGRQRGASSRCLIFPAEGLSGWRSLEFNSAGLSVLDTMMTFSSIKLLWWKWFLWR